MKVFLVALRSCMLIRFRALPVLAFLLLTFSTQRTEAQATLTSIAVTSAIKQNNDISIISTGSFAALTVTGTFSDGSTQDVTSQASWSSSDASSISVSTTGVLTAIKGTESSVTITASIAGVQPATIEFSVVPQTALFGVDGQNVYVYDVTFNQSPAYVTKINYSSAPETSIYSAPMAFSEDGATLYVAKFSPDSSSASDFIIQAFDVSQLSPTQFTKPMPPPSSSITSGLCYPSGLVVKAHKLYVVNAGPKAHVSNANPPACSDAPNILIYNEAPLTYSSTVPIDSPDAGPIGIAASINPSLDVPDPDPYVYVTDPYYKTAKDGKPAGAGTVHVLDSTSDKIVKHVTVQMWPVGVTVGTSYPSGATSSSNTVYFVGPSLGTPHTESIQALQCVPSGNPPPTCTLYGSAPYQFATPGSSNSDLWPVSMNVSPDGKNVYLADPTVSDDVGMFSVVDPVDPAKITGKFYVCQNCQGPTGIAANSAGDSVFASFNNNKIQQLDIPAFTPPTGGGLVATPYHFRGLAISQNPEAQLKITGQSESSATGFTVKSILTVNGNFQNTFAGPDNANFMGFDWGDDSDDEYLTLHIGTPTGSKSFDVSHTYKGAGDKQFKTASIKPDSNQALMLTTIGILGSISVGPVKVTVSPSGTSANPIKVRPGGTIQFQSSVYPPLPSDQTVVWQVNGQTGGGPSVGTIDNSSDPKKNGQYTAPTSGSNISSTPKITITAVPNVDTTKPSDSVYVAVSGPVVTLDPENTLDFGDQPVTTPATLSTPRTVTLTNSGSENLSITQIALVAGGTNPASNDFTIRGNSCSNSLAAGSKCTISVAFVPTSIGERTAALSITDNAAGSPHMISLSGTGVTPSQVRLTPNPLDFGKQNVGTSASMTVTLTNTGQTNLTLGTPPSVIVGDNQGDTPEDFSINPNPATTTCIANLPIAQNGSCSISVIFKPTASGERSAELHVIDNAGGTAGAIQKVQLEGVGAPSGGVVISLFPSNPDVEAATTQQFTANFEPPQSAGPVAWSVSGSSCGGHACGTIDTNGLYSAPATLSGLATDTVTATLVSNTAVSGSTQVYLFLKPSLNTNGQSQTVTAGQTATYNLSLAGGTGDPTKPLTIACHQSLLPTGVNCSSVTVQPGASNSSFTLTVSTSGPQGLALLSFSSKFISIGLIFPVGAIALCIGRRRNCNGRRVLLVVALLGAVLALGALGCGTNGSFSQPTPKNFSQTPTGTYTIQLDGVGPSGIADEEIGHIQLVVK